MDNLMSANHIHIFILKNGSCKYILSWYTICTIYKLSLYFSDAVLSNYVTMKR